MWQTGLAMVLRAFLIWLLLLATAILNGLFRVSVLNPRLGPDAGHLVSTILLCAEVLAIAWLTIRWIGPGAPRHAIAIGGLWLLLTVAFEFGFGRTVGQRTWSEMLADYNVLQGRIWIAALITIAGAPLWAGRLRRLWRLD